MSWFRRNKANYNQYINGCPNCEVRVLMPLEGPYHPFTICLNSKVHPLLCRFKPKEVVQMKPYKCQKCDDPVATKVGTLNCNIVWLCKICYEKYIIDYGDGRWEFKFADEFDYHVHEQCKPKEDKQVNKCKLCSVEIDVELTYCFSCFWNKKLNEAKNKMPQVEFNIINAYLEKEMKCSVCGIAGDGLRKMQDGTYLCSHICYCRRANPAFDKFYEEKMGEIRVGVCAICMDISPLNIFRKCKNCADKHKCKSSGCYTTIDLELTYCVSCAGGNKEEPKMKIKMPDIYKVKLQRIIADRAFRDDHHKATSEALDALANSYNALDNLYKIDNRFDFKEAFNVILDKLEEILK